MNQIEIFKIFELKELINNKNIISVILYGSYATKTQNNNSDIDILLIIEKENDISKTINDLYKNFKIEIQTITKEDFKSKIDNFNPQLISLFYEGIIIKDNNRFYEKCRNLFLAIYRKKTYNIKFKKKEYSMKKLVAKFGG